MRKFGSYFLYFVMRLHYMLLSDDIGNSLDKIHKLNVWDTPTSLYQIHLRSPTDWSSYR